MPATGNQPAKGAVRRYLSIGVDGLRVEAPCKVNDLVLAERDLAKLECRSGNVIVEVSLIDRGSKIACVVICLSPVIWKNNL